MVKFYKGQSIYRFGEISQSSIWANWASLNGATPMNEVGVLEKDLEIDNAKIVRVSHSVGGVVGVQVRKVYYVNDTDFVLVSDAEKIEASLPKTDSTTQTPSKSRRNITIAIIVIVVIVIVGYLLKRNR